MNDCAAHPPSPYSHYPPHPLSAALLLSLSPAPLLAIPPPFPSFSFLLSLTVALLLCALGGRRVAILALGLFCQTDYGTSSVSLAPLHPIMRPASSLLPGSLSLCLLVSVLIRHFAEYISTTRYYVDVHKPSPSLAQSACLPACLPTVRT